MTHPMARGHGDHFLICNYLMVRLSTRASNWNLFPWAGNQVVLLGQKSSTNAAKCLSSPTSDNWMEKYTFWTPQHLVCLSIWCIVYDRRHIVGKISSQHKEAEHVWDEWRNLAHVSSFTWSWKSVRCSQCTAALWQDRNAKSKVDHSTRIRVPVWGLFFFAECIRFGTAVSKNKCQSVLGGDTEPQFAPSNSFIGVNG